MFGVRRLLDCIEEEMLNAICFREDADEEIVWLILEQRCHHSGSRIERLCHRFPKFLRLIRNLFARNVEQVAHFLDERQKQLRVDALREIRCDEAGDHYAIEWRCRKSSWKIDRDRPLAMRLREFPERGCFHIIEV